MIFVSVGTDLFPFNRLIRELDRLKAEKVISEEVFCQIGYSTYLPGHCRYVTLLPFEEMERTINESSIPIIHAGPATIMQVLRARKIPIVVPRLKSFGEVVDDHQLYFTQKLAAEGKVIPVYAIEDLKGVVTSYAEEVLRRTQRTPINDNPIQQSEVFSQKLESLCLELFKKGRQ